MTEQTTSPADATERSPFDPGTPGTARGFPRWSLPVALVGVAIIATWWFTPSRSGAVAASGADHATPTDTGRSAVMLSAEAAARIGVTYAEVTRGSLAGEVRTVGLVTYDETRVKAIAPKVEGWVEQLYVSSTGQTVEEGEPFLRLYSPMLVTAQEELLLARKLAADVGSGGGDAARRAEALLASARRRLAWWDIPDVDIARIEGTGEVLKALTLRSPVRGVVVQKNVLVGQRIMPGDALYQVADLREVWLEGEVFERDLAAVRVGQAVVGEFAALPGRPREGQIVYVAPTLSADSRTARIRVALANPGLQLKPGMYATIRIRGTARTAVLQVPRSALLVTGERTLVFVRGADQMLVAREVQPGQAAGDLVEILRGLVAGETVVASATFLVDAESNLRASLGNVGGMPGMDHGAPPAPPKKRP